MDLTNDETSANTETVCELFEMLLQDERWIRYGDKYYEIVQVEGEYDNEEVISFDDLAMDPLLKDLIRKRGYRPIKRATVAEVDQSQRDPQA